MRSLGHSMAVGVVLGFGCLAAACVDAVAEYYTPLTDPDRARTTTGTGSGGGVAPGCDPSTHTQAVADSCGLFVSSSKGSDASGKGTKEAPYKTLGKALGKAGGKPVYACGEGFKETITISKDAMLFGALDCSKGWEHDVSKKTKLTGGSDAIPLAIAGAETRSTSRCITSLSRRQTRWRPGAHRPR